MVQETITYNSCSCSSTNIIRNRSKKGGNLQYHCKVCGIYQVLKPQIAYLEKTHKTILKACKERLSLRRIEQIIQGNCQTVAHEIYAHSFAPPDEWRLCPLFGSWRTSPSQTSCYPIVNGKQRGANHAF